MSIKSLVFFSMVPDCTHDGSVNGLKFTADGLHLITIGTDQKVFTWDVHSGKKLSLRYPPVSHIKKRSVKFCLTRSGSPNFAFIPTGSSITTFNIFAPGKGTQMYGHYSMVNCCVYHEPGNQLVSGGNDQKILIWTLGGDKNYDDYLCDKQLEMMERKRTADEESVCNVVPAAVAQTMDTWSDED